MPVLQLAAIVNQRLVLKPEALQVVRQFPPNTKFVGVIGVGRGGKSFLNKHLSGQHFPVSNELQPCTYGVWISEPQQQPNGEYIVYVDSEGTEMGDTSQQHKILVLVCLLLWDGGVLIDNEWNYSHSSLNALTLLATAHQLIRGVDGGGWPYLCFLLRNFNNPLIQNGRPLTTDEFLEYFLAARGDGRDEDRRVIRECFPRRMLHTLPIPTDADLAGDQLPPGRFRTAFTDLQNRVLSVATTKKIGGTTRDGAVLAAFLEECVAKINERGNITMTSAIETAMDTVCFRFTEELFASYKDGMQNIGLTGNDQPLQAQHNSVLQATLDEYNNRTQGIYPVSVAKYLQVLQQKIGTHISLVLAENRAVRDRIERDALARRLAEEQAAREAAERRGNQTFLNSHGFKFGGYRIW